MLRRTSRLAAFALLEARRRPARGVSLIGPVPSSLTCVVRLPADLAATIHGVVRDLPGVQPHYLYPAADLHLTILNLGQDERALWRAERILSLSRPFVVQLSGLGLTGGSVFVRAFDQTGELVALRRRLLSTTGLRADWPRRRLGFVNVLRFRQPDLGPLPEAVRVLRGRSFGALEVRVAEIVRTDRVLSADGTTLLSRTELGGDR